MREDVEQALGQFEDLSNTLQDLDQEQFEAFCLLMANQINSWSQKYKVVRRAD